MFFGIRNLNRKSVLIARHLNFFFKFLTENDNGGPVRNGGFKGGGCPKGANR